MQARLPCHANGNTPIVTITATLCGGTPMQSVCQTLGLQDGKYHFIRCSKLCHDIQIIFQNMRSRIKSVNFPELDWVLTDGHQIIIFCATIALGFCVVAYLWRVAKHNGFQNREQHIRMYNLLNWPSYNSKTLDFLNNNEHAQVTVATETLSVGINSPAQTVVQYGLPSTVEDGVQKTGRIRKACPNSHGIIYLP